MTGSRYCGAQPAISVGVADEPDIRPIPEYDIPIIVRNIPIPTPLATFTEAGIILTSHCRMPINDKKTKIKPSTNTAVRANL
jgi:hypothetical protein